MFDWYCGKSEDSGIILPILVKNCSSVRTLENSSDAFKSSISDSLCPKILNSLNLGTKKNK